MTRCKTNFVQTFLQLETIFKYNRHHHQYCIPRANQIQEYHHRHLIIVTVIHQMPLTWIL